ncbi:MAG: hypothetical protein H6725_19795 [Sandaracinaceae bacterium]|nr:hypothetical protein [Sandaracinaceae bacterium]
MNRFTRCSLSRPVRSLALALALTAAAPVSLGVSGAAAQAARARPRGEVTGVEITLEGGLEARRGGPLRWLITTYEVTGTHTLRLAPGAQIRLSSSLQGAADVEAVSDARGRAILQLPIPDDAPGAVGVVVEVRTANNVQRRFEVSISVRETRALDVGLIPAQAAPGETVFAALSLTQPHTGVGVPEAELRVELRDQRGPLGEPVRVRTDAAGLALVPLAIPLDAQQGRLSVNVTHLEPSTTGPRRVTASGSLTLTRSVGAPIHVGVLPARVLAGSEERVPVEVVVRRANGRPVPGAVVTHNGIRGDADEPPLTTDSRGRASFVWRAPRVATGVSDGRVNVSVTRAGLGSASGSSPIRTHAQDLFVDAAFEGGALPAALGGRIYAYVVRADGRPAANVPVSFEGPRVGSAQATTDASGMAFIDASLAAADEARDTCGGIASTALTITAGSGPRAGRHEVCMPVDTDTQVRVRAPAIVAPGPVALTLARAPGVARAPVVISAFARDGNSQDTLGVEALASVVTDTDEATLVLPPDVPVQVFFRARPLIDGREVRGAFASSWVRRSDALTPTVRFDPSGRALVSGLPAGTPFLALAVPAEEARAMYEDVLRSGMTQASALEAEARLARSIPVDSAAPVRQTSSGLVSQPMPEDATQRGLLRDPWRASSRFVEGRLALLFRQVEDRVESALPNDLDDITVVTRGRRELTRQVFATLAGEATTGLGGEPLSLADVQSLDSSFDFDHVARRITRRRLFRLLVILRDLVRDNGLDLPWARPGDPAEWLAHLPGRSGVVGHIQPSDLVDGWGRPFELRATTRPRYTQLQPVAGFELSSAGPDGRAGNGDDVVDPTARVLQSGGLYARAVGEDALVARLQSVELGRATVELAVGPVQVEAPSIPAPSEVAASRAGGGSAVGAWSVPSILERDPYALALKWRGSGQHAAAAQGVARAGTTPVPLALGDVPTTWGVILLARDAVGTVGAALDVGLAGTPIVAEAELPTRVRVGEPLSVPFYVTNTSDANATYGLSVQADDALSAELPGTVAVPAGESRELMLVLTGQQPGHGALRVQVTREGEPQRTLEQRIAVDRGRHPMRRWGTGVARGDQYSVDLRVPSDAVDPRTRVVLLTPGALAGDPTLSEVRERQPGAMAWSAVSAGRGVPAELRALLVRQDTQPVALAEHAARVMALTSVVALDPTDAEALAALRRAQSQLGRRVGRLDSREQAVQVATAFTVLAAGGVPDEDSSDPLAGFMSSARVALRRALFVHRGDAGVMARVAAALLVADPEDGYGLALYQRALSATRLRSGARRVTLDDALATGSEATGAALSLALAAHQVGQEAERDQLVRGAMQTFASVARDPDDALLYWFALSAYGALGVGDPEGLEVNVGGGWQPVTLDQGRATIDVSLAPGGRLRAKVRTRGGSAVYARVETVFGARFEERADAPFTLSLEGDVGRVGGVAGLVLQVQAGSEAVAQPVVELQLPAGVRDDEALAAALSAPAVVLSAEVRRPGFVRLTLASLNAEQSHNVPLTFRWTTPSAVRGLGAAGYDASHPTRMTVLPPRTLTPAPADADLR